MKDKRSLVSVWNMTDDELRKEATKRRLLGEHKHVAELDRFREDRASGKIRPGHAPKSKGEPT